jgi:CheY-like chemotaxis protein
VSEKQTDIKKSSVIEEDLNWSGKTILIAEDEESNYMFFEMLIKNTKAKIMRAENGKEVIEKCKDYKIDLILMDIKMPIMDGLEATKIIKSIKPKLPIISVSAYSSKEDSELSINAGCEEHLSKPIQRQKLLTTIKKYFGK